MSQITELLGFVRKQIPDEEVSLNTLVRVRPILIEAATIESELTSREANDDQPLLLQNCTESLKRALVTKKREIKRLMLEYEPAARRKCERLENFHDTGLISEPQTIDS
jgi:hypothetical protein